MAPHLCMRDMNRISSVGSYMTDEYFLLQIFSDSSLDEDIQKFIDSVSYVEPPSLNPFSATMTSPKTRTSPS